MRGDATAPPHPTRAYARATLSREGRGESLIITRRARGIRSSRRVAGAPPAANPLQSRPACDMRLTRRLLKAGMRRSLMALPRRSGCAPPTLLAPADNPVGKLALPVSAPMAFVFVWQHKEPVF
jgi:hypothetical protein